MWRCGSNNNNINSIQWTHTHKHTYIFNCVDIEIHENSFCYVCHYVFKFFSRNNDNNFSFFTYAVQFGINAEQQRQAMRCEKSYWRLILLLHIPYSGNEHMHFCQSCKHMFVCLSIYHNACMLVRVCIFSFFLAYWGYSVMQSLWRSKLLFSK